MTADNESGTPRQVVGLHYDVGQGLPQVVLKGSGRIAEEMLHRRPLVGGPPVIRNPELAQRLYRLPVDAEIGPELFHLVAALLAHVFAVEDLMQGRSDA